jgi:hypothetical protein
MFLDERLHDQPSLNLLRSQQWSFVILQAQKYSESGQFHIRRRKPRRWVRMSRDAARGADHVSGVAASRHRRNAADFRLHVSIAQAEPACVPPIPQAFDIALARHPTLGCMIPTAITLRRQVHSSRR